MILIKSEIVFCTRFNFYAYFCSTNSIIYLSMKRKTVIFAALLICSIFVSGTTFAVLNQKADSCVMTKKGSTYVVNTTQLGKNVRGFNGPTPLMIYIKSNKIVKIEPLQNRDTPNFFNRASKRLIDYYIGKKVNSIVNTEVDAVSGATYSSKAIIENVKLGVSYYKENKKK